jgi:hypothetical protein
VAQDQVEANQPEVNTPATTAQGVQPPAREPVAEVEDGQDDPFAWESALDPALGESDETPPPAATTKSGSESAPVKAEAPPEKKPVEQVHSERPELHSPQLVAVAMQLGFSREEIEGMPTKALDRAVRSELRALEVAEKAKSGDQPAKSRPPQEDAGEIDFGVDADGKPIKGEEVFDPAVINALKHISKKYESKIASLEDKLNRREAREAGDSFDRAFEGLGEDFKELFGDGPGRNMAKDDPNFTRRLLVLQAAGIDLDVDTPKAVAKKVKDAVGLVYKGFAPSKSDKTEKQIADEAKHAARVEMFGEGAVARPTGRRHESQNPRTRAEEAVAKTMEAMGINVKDDKQAEKDLLDSFL